jgi:hypothetical protein
MGRRAEPITTVSEVSNSERAMSGIVLSSRYASAPLDARPAMHAL